MSEFLVVYITASGENARDLASALVREKLAACVNRIPGVESTYTWEGRVERDTEDLLIVKTRDRPLRPAQGEGTGAPRLRRPGDHRRPHRRGE